MYMNLMTTLIYKDSCHRLAWSGGCSNTSSQRDAISTIVTYKGRHAAPGKAALIGGTQSRMLSEVSLQLSGAGHLLNEGPVVPPCAHAVQPELSPAAKWFCRPSGQRQWARSSVCCVHPSVRYPLWKQQSWQFVVRPALVRSYAIGARAVFDLDLKITTWII